NMCGPCGLTALGATLRLALAEMILIKLLEAAPFMWNCERCGERGLLWTTDRACRRICAGQAVCEPISDARPRRNSNAVHLWRFSYRQTTWLLTRGGSESLGKSRLPPSIPKRRAFDGPDGGTGLCA